jgi:glycosyltransferase involved in cell wall biosynthesis
MDSVKYSVVIPAYNEQDNIKPLVDELRRVLGSDSYEIVLVDDNSSDKTPGLCDKLSASDPKIKALHRKQGRNGMGFALCEGTLKASGKYVVWVMGDRSDKLETIGEIVRMLDGGYDMVIASRYMFGGSRGELGVDKAMYGSVYSRLASWVFRIPVHDITNAFRGFRKDIMTRVSLESGDFAISPEFAIKAHLAGFRLGQVPTTYFNRRAGQTKFRIFRMGLRYLSLFKLRLSKC